MLSLSLLCITAMAQWTKPAAPTAQAPATGTELYLFNTGAEAFFVGANEYGTRASFSPVSGHRVVLVASADDAESYQLTNAADAADTFLPLYILGVDGVWVDESGNNTGDDLFTLLPQGDGKYQIGLSPLNSEYNPTLYADTYLGIIPEKGDTRLYLTDPQTFVDGDGYTTAGFQTTWIFVLPADYTTYTTAMKAYLASEELAAMIAKAQQTTGLADGALTAAQAVYADATSTEEALTNATATLRNAINDANLKAASVSAPFEMLQMLGTVEQTFTNSKTTGWTSTTLAQNKQASNGNNAADYNTTGNHYENWSGSAFGTGRIYATLADLPNGAYHFNALAFANVTGGTYLYAGNNKTLIESTQININQETDVYAIVTDGTLEFGLRVEEQGPNWVGLDNVNLYYLGGDKESYDYVAQLALDEVKDYQALIDENPDLVYGKAEYDAYVKTKTVLEEAMKAETSADEYGKNIAACIDAYKQAADLLGQSIDAYEAYIKVINDAEDWLGSMSNGSDQANILADYLMEDSEPAEGVYNGNGGSQYILQNGSLDVTQIKAETTYLAQLLNDAVASGMSDGDDCTELLKNPQFSEVGGWTSAVGPVWPTGDVGTMPVVEATNMVCDVYQQLTGLQNGLYEMNLQAAFRPGAEYTDENEAVAKAYAYINSYETRLPSGDNGEGLQLNSAQEASVAFADGLYPMTVYGLVTDGTMRIGITNKVRSVENCILWAGNVSLTFRAKNEEVLNTVIQQTIPVAQALLDNYLGQPELTALRSAIEAASAPDDAYSALIDLKAAMEAVEEGTAVYANLAIALRALDEAIAAATDASAVTLANAQEVLTTAQNAYTDQTYSTAEAEQAISDVNAAAVAVKMGGEKATEDNPVNYTSAIVNNTFDPARGDKNAGAIEGWTTTAMNGYKEYTVSYNRAPFELNQKITGLPKGNYKVTVHTYYRAGYYNEEEAYIAEGRDTHLTTLYAETSEDKYTKPVLNLSEGATTELLTTGKYYTLSNGLYAPDGTSPTAEYFAAGAYLNELRFTVPADGEVTIGLSKTEVFANDYEVVGAWELWYMGDPDEEVKADTIDVTSLIVNNTFDPARGDKNAGTIEGWTTTAMNGYKEYTVSYNRAPFELYQDLSGLPAGKYIATVHTYYRAGYYNEEEAYIAEGRDTHLTTLYAETSEDKYTKPVLNLSEGATTELLTTGKYYTLSNGLYAPDGTTPTAEYFAAGAYLNTIEFTVPADGKVRIGLSKTEVYANDYEVVGEWRLYYIQEPETTLEEKDVTSLIVNNTFDPARGDKNAGTIEGWTTTAMNGYKEYTVSYNRAPFELSQELSGLPEGTYKVTVHTYYRAGYYNEEEAYIAEGRDTHLTTLYAETADDKYAKAVLNLSEGATTELLTTGKYYTLSNGLYAPDGTTPTAEYFAAGAYLNELYFYVPADGHATIGLSKTGMYANDYEVVGEWRLYYYGNGNHIDELGGNTDTAIKSITPTISEGREAIYNVNGQQMGGLQNGLNIVRMADGRTVKVLIRK